MGLDMFVFAVRAEKVKEANVDVDICFKDLGIEQDEVHEVAYWRKHHDLHGWMQRLYEKKGGKDPQFNCNKVRLTEKDLDDLETAIQDGTLPSTSGFFFGNNPPDEESNKHDLEFIQKARAAIKEGMAIFYDSWW